MNLTMYLYWHKRNVPVDHSNALPYNMVENL